MSALRLVLVAEENKITAIFLERKFLRFFPVASATRTDGENLLRTLLALKETRESREYAAAWENPVAVCLGPEKAIFRDFSLPPVSARAAKKSVELSLEGDFPFEREQTTQNIFFWRDVPEKRSYAVVTLAPRKTLESWRDALEAAGVDKGAVYFAPWPLLAGLPRFSGASLLVILWGENGALAALDKNGLPRRVAQLPESDAPAEERAKEIWTQRLFLLSGTSFKPDRIIFFAVDAPDISRRLAEISSLPVEVAGRDFPLAGVSDRPGETERERTLAAGLLNSLKLNLRTRFPLKLAANPNRGARLRRGILWACAGVLMLCAGLSFSLDTLARNTRAAALNAAAEKETRAALGDAPKNAGRGRLEAILNSRLTALERGEAKTGFTVLKTLEAIHVAAPPAMKIETRRFTWDNDHIRLYGRAGSYEEVNEFKENLAKIAGVTEARVVNAANRGEKGSEPGVEFELDLTREKQ